MKWKGFRKKQLRLNEGTTSTFGWKQWGELWETLPCSAEKPSIVQTRIILSLRL
jgi:hypothetical protein